MDNIIFEKQRNGKLVFYGRGGTPFKCVKAKMIYGDVEKTNFIPVTFGRYGYDIFFDEITTEEEIEARPDLVEYFMEKYTQLSPESIVEWKEKMQNQFSGDTKEDQLFRTLFDRLNERVANNEAAPGNPNPQKLVQSLRDRGLCILTESQNHTTYLRLVEGINTLGFENEIIPEEIRKRALELYGNIDALSGIRMPDDRLIIEHKFPEERWKNRPAEDNLNMTDEEIKNKFQLLTAQYNQVKREACKKCVRFKKRQAPFGITYFYEGDEEWGCDDEFGQPAEDGCVGCGWYDVATWKELLIIAANGGYIDDEDDDE